MSNIIGVGQLSLLDLNDAVISGQPPSNPSVGSLWINEDSNPVMLNKWNGLKWVEVGELDPNLSVVIDDINETLGNMANDSIINFQERQVVKDRLSEIIGNVISDTATSLPTSSSLDSGEKGGFWSVRKSALNAGISSSDNLYTNVETRYNNLRSYLGGLTPIKPWDVRSSNKDVMISVVKSTFRDRWLQYYLAVDALATATAEKLKQNVDDIEVGGRNIVTKKNAGRGNVSLNGYKFTFTGSSSTGSGVFIRIHRDNFERDTKYVASFKVRKISGTVNTIAGHVNSFRAPWKIYRDGELISENSSHSWSNGDRNYPDDNEIHEYEIHFTTPSTWSTGDSAPYFYIQPNRPNYGLAYELELWDYQIEKGTKKTGWSPSPEDIQDEINDVAKEISDVKLEVTDSAIIGKVTSSSVWNKSVWDRASGLRSDGTLPPSNIYGNIPDSKIGSASEWNAKANEYRVSFPFTSSTDYVILLCRSDASGVNNFAVGTLTGRRVSGYYSSGKVDVVFNNSSGGNSPSGYFEATDIQYTNSWSMITCTYNGAKYVALRHRPSNEFGIWNTDTRFYGQIGSSGEMLKVLNISDVSNVATFNSVGEVSSPTIRLDERLSSAELKITDSSIVSTVTSSQSWKSLDDTAKSVSDTINSNEFRTVGNNYFNDVSIPSGSGGRWYRIAYNRGDRAHAKFIVRDVTSSQHSVATFEAGIHYGKNPYINLISYGRYASRSFTRARILYNSTYDEVYLELYINNNSRAQSLAYWITENIQSNGWVGVDWTSGSIPSGYQAFYKDINEDSVTDRVANVANDTAKTLRDSTIPSLSNRVVSAESSITQLSNQISSKVSQTDFNGNTIASLINQTATTININASKINLKGAVSVLSDIAGSLGTITAGNIRGARIVSTGTSSSDNVTIDNGRIDVKNGGDYGETFIRGRELEVRDTMFNDRIILRPPSLMVREGYFNGNTSSNYNGINTTDIISNRRNMTLLINAYDGIRHSGGDLNFFTDNSRLIHLRSTAHAHKGVVIGTTIPTSQPEGSIYYNGTHIRVRQASGWSDVMDAKVYSNPNSPSTVHEFGIISSGVTSNRSSSYYIGHKLASTWYRLRAGYADVAGSVSLENMKSSISLLPFDSLKKIEDSNIYQWQYKNDEENKMLTGYRYGLVIGRETPREVIDLDGERVDHLSMISLSWDAIKILSNKNRELEKEVKELKSAIKDIRSNHIK